MTYVAPVKPRRKSRRRRARHEGDPLAKKWVGSPEQRYAWWEKKERERRARTQRAQEARQERWVASAEKRDESLKHQAQLRAQRDADAQAERRAKEALARALRGHP